MLNHFSPCAIFATSPHHREGTQSMAGMRYQKIVDRLRVLADKVRHHYSDGIKAQQPAAKHALRDEFRPHGSTRLAETAEETAPLCFCQYSTNVAGSLTVGPAHDAQAANDNKVVRGVWGQGRCKESRAGCACPSPRAGAIGPFYDWRLEMTRDNRLNEAIKMLANLPNPTAQDRRLLDELRHFLRRELTADKLIDAATQVLA
jgi:hypothetical protein